MAKNLDAEAKKAKTKELEAAMRAARKREWYERFRWFTSSEGVLVIAGKDSDQNISIIRNYLKPNQWALHADVHGSPLAAVQSDAQATGEATISEAADFVASYSKAWQEGSLSIKVSAFLGEQVSLSPPSGTYLSKGAFMIYGKKREVDAQLRLAIGVEVEKEGKWFRVLAAPPSALKGRVSAVVVIKPGETARQKLAADVKKRLAYELKKAGSPVAEMIRETDVEPLLPSGSGTIVTDADVSSSKIEG